MSWNCDRSLYLGGGVGGGLMEDIQTLNNYRTGGKGVIVGKNNLTTPISHFRLVLRNRSILFNARRYQVMVEPTHLQELN